jgi:signal transduction histidine kinase
VRTILALNGYVLGLTLVMGWVAQETAGRLVEERYVTEMVASASAFLDAQNLPRSDVMMGHLRRLFNAEWIAVEAGARGVAASSLSPAASEAFERQTSAGSTGGVVVLDGQRYRYGSAVVGQVAPGGAAGSQGRLYMLVPDQQFQAARDRARWRVAMVIVPAAAAATVMAMLLSLAMTRPLRRLSGEMDQLSYADVAGDQARPRRRRSPREIARLAESFDRLLERLAQARRQMVQSEQLAALGKMSLSVAHELRNPLSGIKMNMRVLQDREGLRDDPGVAAIVREVDRMGLYLDELMSLAPQGQSERDAERASHRLSELAASVLVILAGRLRHANIAIETSVCPDEPPAAVHENQIRQVMMNLLVNAIEASPPGGAIGISVRRRGGRVRFVVSDQGNGVAEGTDVFEAFVSAKPNGVGLGLYICKKVVTAHGGEVGYESSPSGSEFWFEIPILVEGHEAPGEAQAARAAEQGGET